MATVDLDSSALRSTVAFTGRLACMSRAEAFEVVREHGGTPSQSVTKRTNVLVVGEMGWPLLDDGRPSHKLSRATQSGVRVVSERRFLEWVGRATPDSADKTYSAEQIAALSKLSGDLIQELAQFGLLDERGGRFGFRDLASARQVARLLTEGVRLREIIRSVIEVRKWLPEAGLASVRFHSAPRRALELEQVGERTDPRGQFVLPVIEPHQENADDLFGQAQLAEDAGDFAEAERLYCLMMKCDPADGAAPFNLGNLLSRAGRNVEAEAAFRAATRADLRFAEAWYNLSDLLDRQARAEEAMECLRSALRAAPDYADAAFNLGLLLQRTNRHKEAAECWRLYLSLDGLSDWAARAKRALKFCEMQFHQTAS